ncbi:MAG TPA: hypothetical protein VJP87_12120 [Candidatus Acidoferrales bacterium]|nr:hypothetical protein [Candidatus Acidoferrales bacterium]
MFGKPAHLRPMLLLILVFLACVPALRAQARPGRSSAFTEIKWDTYVFKFMPGNQMAQVLDSDGHVIATILSMGGELKLLPTITGDAADKLQKSFQAWKDQGGEKTLASGAAPATPGASRVPRTPSPQPTSPAAPPSAAPVAAPSAAPAAAPTASASDVSPAARNATAKSAPGHGILTADELSAFGNGTVPLDLISMRFHPELLAQKPVMQYFIALNNCHDSSVERALQNELDYPALASFYSAKAQEILAGLPDAAGFITFRGYKGGLLWGRSAKNGEVTPGADEKRTLSLGEYDISRKVFPILTSDQAKSFEVSGTQGAEINRASLEKSCPVAYNTFMRSRLVNVMPTGYAVTVASPMTFNELPMSEADARKFIEGAAAGPAQREVVLGVELHLKPDAQKSNAKQFVYDGTIARITVMKRASFQPVGILYDDHTLPPPPPPPTIPSAVTTMKSTREFNEEVITAVYVSLASDACGWPIAPEQNAALKRYISDVNTYGKFNQRESLNGVMGNIRNAINDPSRHFCENPTERQDYARRVATVFPKGPMAAPAPPAN